MRTCLTIDPSKRPTAKDAVLHPWLSSTTPHFVPDPQSAVGTPTDLLPHIKKAFDAKKTCTSELLASTRLVMIHASYYGRNQSGKRYSV